MNQDYNKYTEEDFLVWETLFTRQMEILPKVASSEYLQGIEYIGFQKNKIPNFTEMNTILGRSTGWGLTVVPNIIPESEFFPLLSNKKFSATTWLRKMSELDSVKACGACDL